MVGCPCSSDSIHFNECKDIQLITSCYGKCMNDIGALSGSARQPDHFVGASRQSVKISMGCPVRIMAIPPERA